MPILIKKLPKTRVPRQPVIGPIHYNYNDPMTPNLTAEVPVPLKTKLPVHITGYIGGGQPANSVAGQAASCLVTIANALDYISQFTKQPLKRWAGTNILKVEPRAGIDLNAYYNRQALKFFYVKDPIQKKFVFTSDSADVVSHELGHAVLDSIRPDLWNVPSFEVAAFHEAFGDCHTLLTMFSQEKIIDYVLQETKGNLAESNVVTKIAEELGLTLYNLEKNKTGLNPIYLREIVNSFKYIEPEKLPNDAYDDQLSRQSHSFSRIWTATFYDFIVKVYKKHCSEMPAVEAVRKARDVAAHYLLHAVADAPLTNRFFAAMAQQMLAVDGLAGRVYRELLLECFMERNILQHTVSMLSAGHISDFKNLGVRQDNTIKIRKTKSLKLTDHMGVMALDYNPLHYAEIEVPLDEMYYFDENGMLLSAITCDIQEAINSTCSAVDFLYRQGYVSNNETTPFELRNNHLIRTHIACRCKSTACDPNSPEYGKGYKPQNNAGCCGKGLPRTCDECEPAEPTTRPKLGCYTNVRTGALTRYKNGSSISRKVC